MANNNNTTMTSVATLCSFLKKIQIGNMLLLSPLCCPTSCWHAISILRFTMRPRRGANCWTIYRYDDLVVLKRFNGPAVLFEAAVVVNRDEEVVADTPERHKLIADAMFDAIEEFC